MRAKYARGDVEAETLRSFLEVEVEQWENDGWVRVQRQRTSHEDPVNRRALNPRHLPNRDGHLIQSESARETERGPEACILLL